MKDFFKSLASAGLAIGLAVLGFAAEAQTAVPPLIYGLTNTVGSLSITNGITSTIATLGTSNYSTVPFPIWRDRGFVLHMASVSSSASATGGAGAILQLATPHSNYQSGTNAAMVTNWDNSLLFSWTSAGTTEVFYSTNVPKIITDNYTIGRLLSVTNGSTVSISIDPTNSFISATP